MQTYLASSSGLLEAKSVVAIKLGVFFGHVANSAICIFDRRVYGQSQMSDGIYAGREHLSTAVHRPIAPGALAFSIADLEI